MLEEDFGAVGIGEFGVGRTMQWWQNFVRLAKDLDMNWAQWGLVDACQCSIFGASSGPKISKSHEASGIVLRAPQRNKIVGDNLSSLWRTPSYPGWVAT